VRTARPSVCCLVFGCHPLLSSSAFPSARGTKERNRGSSIQGQSKTRGRSSKGQGQRGVQQQQSSTLGAADHSDLGRRRKGKGRHGFGGCRLSGPNKRGPPEGDSWQLTGQRHAPDTSPEEPGKYLLSLAGVVSTRPNNSNSSTSKGTSSTCTAFARSAIENASSTLQGGSSDQQPSS